MSLEPPETHIADSEDLVKPPLMPQILHICASPRADASTSNRLAEEFLSVAGEGSAVTALNVFDEALPAFEGFSADSKLAFMSGQTLPPAQTAAFDVGHALIEQLRAADKVVVSTGMWNFGVPYALKHYLDLVVQPGRTFEMTETGEYVGLLTGKPLAILVATGGAYEGPMDALDMCAPYLKNIFGLMGFQDIRTVVCPMTAFPPEVAGPAREAAIGEAKAAAEGF